MKNKSDNKKSGVAKDSSRDIENKKNNIKDNKVLNIKKTSHDDAKERQKDSSGINVETKLENKKDKKTTFNLLEVIIIMIITALFGAFIGSAVVYFNNNKSVVKIGNKDLDEFVTTYNSLLSDYYTELDKEKLLDAGIKGMIEYLDDPYSSYMDEDVSDDFNEKIDGNYVGMGVEIQKQKDNSIKIVTIFENSPAEKAGFALGDIIVKVGNKDIEGMDTNDVSNLIKGEIGTKVKITINRDEQEKELELTRENVEIPSVSSEVFEKNDKKVGYIKIDVFAKNTASQFETHLAKMEKANVEGVILDVRGNSGGYLSVVTEIASHFLENDDVVYQLETRGVIKKIYAMSVEKSKLGVAVLIDGSSASASEILASSLNENNDSPLVGVKTYGKGTVQKAHTLESGATIKYTIQSWLTAKGNKIDTVGISPTIKVELGDNYYKDPTNYNDNQLQMAIDEILK